MGAQVASRSRKKQEVVKLEKLNFRVVMSQTSRAAREVLQLCCAIRATSWPTR